MGAVRHFLRAEPKCVEKRDERGWEAWHSGGWLRRHRAARGGAERPPRRGRAAAAPWGGGGSEELRWPRGSANWVHATVERGFTSHQGDTPLHVAAVGGRRAVVLLLLEHRADPEVPRTDGRGPRLCLSLRRGKTPADVADERGEEDVAALLRSAATERPLAAMSQCGCSKSSMHLRKPRKERRGEGRVFHQLLVFHQGDLSGESSCCRETVSGLRGQCLALGRIVDF